MKSFNEWLEIRDPELLSEINWRKARKALGTAALLASPLLGGGSNTLAAEPTAPPAAATAVERPAADQPSSYHARGSSVVDYQKLTGVGGDHIATQKLYKKGYEGISAEETLKTEITTILKSMKGIVVSEDVKIKDVYIEFIEVEKDLGQDTSRIKVYGAVKAEAIIEVHVEISGPGASQEMAYRLAEETAKKLLDSKGFRYRSVKDVMGEKIYGTRGIVKDMGFRPERPQSEQINNSEVFKVELRFEVTR